MSNEIFIHLARGDGHEMRFDGTDWNLVSIMGIDSPQYTVYSEALAVGDGTLVTGQQVTSRDVEFTAELRDTAMAPVMRRVLTSFFSPHHNYKMTVQYQGILRWIGGFTEDDCGKRTGFSCPSGNVCSPLTVTALFTFNKPWWKSMDEFGKDIAAITGRFGFPYLSHPARGFLAGVYNFAKTVHLDNDGDVDTYCTAVIEATDAVVNPRLIIGQAYLRLLDTLVAGDVVRIDFARRTVTKNGTNALGTIDRTSSFTDMVFVPGDNTVGFRADVGENDMKVTLYYNKLYQGV